MNNMRVWSVLVLAGCLAAAGRSDVAPGEATGAGTGTIVGRVFGPDGQPAGGIRIGAWPELRGPGISSVQAEAVTVPDGSYRLTGLAPGRYVIRPLETLQPPQTDEQWHYWSYAGIFVRERGTASTRPLRLVRAAHVTGTVVDADTGRPIRGVRVGHYTLQADAQRAGGGSTPTDSEGRFRVLAPALRAQLYVSTPLRPDGLTRHPSRRYYFRGTIDLKPGETVFKFRVHSDRFNQPLPEPEKAGF